MFKLAYHPKTEEIKQDQSCHAYAIRETGDKFDKWVRAIVFPELKHIYFRFYTPSGDYYFRTEDDTQYSYTVCEGALKTFYTKHLVKKTWKVLFWDTDTKVTPQMVRL